MNMLARLLNALVLLGLLSTLNLANGEDRESLPEAADGCVIPLTTLASALNGAGVEDAYRDATFATIRPAGLSQTIAYLMVQRFIDELGNDYKGFFIHGETKVGKTKLAVAFAHQVASERNLPLAYITRGNASQIWEDGAPESLAKYDVIIFDGLFDRDASDPASERMLSLFRAAVQMTARTSGKKILATSRLALEDVVLKMYAPTNDGLGRRAFERTAFSIFQPAKLMAN